MLSEDLPQFRLHSFPSTSTCLEEVNFGVAVNLFVVEAADVGDAVQRDAHGHLQLRGWHVHQGNALRHRVLHLAARSGIAPITRQ